MQTTVTQEMLDANPILATLGATVGSVVSVFTPGDDAYYWQYSPVAAQG